MWIICSEKQNYKYPKQILNKDEKTTVQYEKVYNGNLRQQLEVYKIFKQNMMRREQLNDEITSYPCDFLVRWTTVRDQ